MSSSSSISSWEFEYPHAQQISAEDERKVIRCTFPECGYRTDKNSNLKRHFETMHKLLEPPLLCCDLRFLTKGAYRLHTRTTHSQGHCCPHCLKLFNRKALLERHMSVHTGSKPFKCSVCKYASANKANVLRHLPTHSSSPSIISASSSSSSSEESFSTSFDITFNKTKPFLSHSIEAILSTPPTQNNNWTAAPPQKNLLLPLPSRISQEINSSRDSSPPSDGLALQLQQFVMHHPTFIRPLPPIPCSFLDPPPPPATTQINKKEEVEQEVILKRNLEETIPYYIPKKLRLSKKFN